MTTGNPSAGPNGPSTGTPDWAWADPSALQLNPTFQRLIPLQSKGELIALKESILQDGFRDPLIVWKGHGVVLDGHTRLQLALELNRKVKVREVDLPDEKAAMEHVLQIQRERRNLTREAMSYLRGAEYNATKQQRGGRRPKAKGQAVPLTTAQVLAAKYGVVDKTIKRDGAFAQLIDTIVTEHGDPDVRRRLLGADVRLTHGLARLLLRETPVARKAMVDQLLQDGQLPYGNQQTKPSAPKPRDIAQSLIARLRKRGAGHPLAVLKQMANLLGMDVREKSKEG